jgi:ArsR family transcriptional regulator
MAIEAVDFCKALADDTRQRILEMLLGGELSVTEIVEAFKMTQPTISHHLNILKQYGLVKARKAGKQVFYAIDRQNVLVCCGKLVTKFEAQDCCR